MKKILILASLMVAATAAFGQATANDTKTVTLNVSSFVAVSIASGATINVTDGGAAGTYHAAGIAYTVNCNVACSAVSQVLNSTLAGGATGHGDIDTTAFTAPGGAGVLDAYVSGLTLANSVANHNKSFDVKITVTED